MIDYIALRIDPSPCSEDITDLLAAFLAEIGYESFVADSYGMTAYINANDFSLEAVTDALSDFPFDITCNFTPEFVKGENWNEEWEKHYFKPIVIGGECVVHSSFHKDIPNAEFDIVVDPKMAFGTGHHATTSMMIRHILMLDVKDRDVIDMGTGTGILAILCKMKGASSVSGIEIDKGAYENAVENCSLNGTDILLINGDASSLSGLATCDLFMANINRNVILSDIKDYAGCLKDNGIMLLSGFYACDIEMIKEEACKYALSVDSVLQDGEWVALKLSKS